MDDEDTELGWRDPYVIIGAVALVAVIAVVIYALITGHFLRDSSRSSSTIPTSRYPIPSGSTQVAPTGTLPYRNCAAAARDGRRNIRIGDPAYNPALDRNHDGIACGRADG